MDNNTNQDYRITNTVYLTIAIIATVAAAMMYFTMSGDMYLTRNTRKPQGTDLSSRIDSIHEARRLLVASIALGDSKEFVDSIFGEPFDRSSNGAYLYLNNVTKQRESLKSTNPVEVLFDSEGKVLDVKYNIQ